MILSESCHLQVCVHRGREEIGVNRLLLTGSPKSGSVLGCAKKFFLPDSF